MHGEALSQVQVTGAFHVDYAFEKIAFIYDLDSNLMFTFLRTLPLSTERQRPDRCERYKSILMQISLWQCEFVVRSCALSLLSFAHLSRLEVRSTVSCSELVGVNTAVRTAGLCTVN